MVRFFSLLLWIPGKNRTKLKKLFNLRSRLTGKHNTPDTQNALEAQHPRYTECTWSTTPRIHRMHLKHNTPDTQNALIIFLSAIAVVQVFWTEDNFCFISDFIFNCKHKKLKNEQIIIIYTPSNAFCSSGESVQIIVSYFHWYVFPFYLVQCANTEFLLIKAQWVLNRSSKCANVRYRKS